MLSLLLSFVGWVRGEEMRVAWPTLRQAQGPLDLDRLVEAIRRAENSPRARIGRKGERGPWQMKPATWAMFSGRPLWWASGEAAACQVEQRAAARREVVWIRACLPELGFSESAWAIGLVHNAGFGNVHARALTPGMRDFALRVANLYEALRQAQGDLPAGKSDLAEQGGFYRR